MTWQEHVRTALDGDHTAVGRTVVFGISALIVISTLSVGIETVPNLPPWATGLLHAFEIVVVAVFTVEYILRVVVAPDRRRYILSFWGIVDLMAILPFYLSLGVDLRAARALRLLRLFRLLKLLRYNRAMDRMLLAMRMVREELVIFVTTAMMTLYLCSLGIWFFEHEAQPDRFGSVFESMWWAAVTLTTVGYGDVYPITVGGRIFTVTMLFVALGIIAIPTGLVGSALARVRHLEPPHHDD